MNRTFFDNLELAAQALNLHNYQLASLELSKALELVTPRRNTQSSAKPQATDLWSELRKGVDALSCNELRLSSVCFKNALSKVQPQSLLQSMARANGLSAAKGLSVENYTTAALHLRKAAELLELQGQAETQNLQIA